MYMKKILAIASVGLLTACSSNPAIDADQLYEDVKAQYFNDTMIEVDASLAKNLLFLEDENSVCIGWTSSTNEISELMICQGSEEVHDKLDARIQYYKDAAERYTPEDVALIENSQLFELQNLSILVMGEQAEEIAQYIQSNY